MDKKINTTENENISTGEEYSLNDDRRVKVLSPSALVAKRFVRNRTAVTGLIVLTFMFLFSFLGGLITPYEEDQLFYREDIMNRTYASVMQVDSYRYTVAEGKEFGDLLRAQFIRADTQKQSSFTYRDVEYAVEDLGEGLYAISLAGGDELAVAYKGVLELSSQDIALSYAAKRGALEAYANKLSHFVSDGLSYTLDEDGVIYLDNQELGYISRYVVKPAMADIFLSRDYNEALISNIEANDPDFLYTNAEGNECTYTISYNPANMVWDVAEARATRVFDTYSAPSKAHWLGTDRNGMDMLTRLMYGGRVSLTIGFIVEIIATVLGVIMGGLAGYFGKWVDMVIMRIVDVFYCIPSMPIIIILGAMMDAMRVDPQLRMIYLMLILGFLGWPSVARMVRGQILSLREQEFMTATEACGIRVSRRIFKHLIPNVIPQLIVSCTMGLGSTIITEATLSFLGLGVKFPFASWGNIINDVNDVYVLTNYLFIWIPAGLLLLSTVLAFNLVGDGLRDAFDPKMKR